MSEDVLGVLAAGFGVDSVFVSDFASALLSVFVSDFASAFESPDEASDFADSEAGVLTPFDFA